MTMALRRVYRKIERTPEQLAELRAVRARFQSEKPSLDDLAASQDYEGPFRHGDVMAFLMAIAELKQERERAGLSLADVSDRTGLDKGMLSRLENGKILNPTLSTLYRVAGAMGRDVAISFPPRATTIGNALPTKAQAPALAGKAASGAKRQIPTDKGLKASAESKPQIKSTAAAKKTAARRKLK
jgi:transcriptional regulator with XRE-family HTH domain